MAKRSRMSVLKRQRELQKAEKAARKRAKRHGAVESVFSEPRPTVDMAQLLSASSKDREKDSDPS